MTNTLHRFGAAESFRDDYIVFAMPAKGINEDGAVDKERAFVRLALKHGPVNMGHAMKAGIYRPSESLTPLAHWTRSEATLDPEVFIQSIDTASTLAAVFDDPAKVEAFLVDLKAADLGLSINISGLTAEAKTCARRAGITRHSVEYSLGFHGDLTRIPDRHVLELSSMCGHGMVSHNFARKMIDWVREGRRTPKQAATYMARFCTCGVFNPARAVRVLEQARKGT
jgi:hypothetical protein